MELSRPREARLRAHAISSDGYEHSPHGILVLSREGRVLGANKRARDLLGSRLGEPSHSGGARCCDVLGCRDAPGVYGSCLTQSALQRTVPLQDVALYGPSGRDVPWLYASLARADGRVVATIRPATVERPPGSGAALRLVTLGRTRLERMHGVDDGEWLGQRPGTLLKLLVARRPRELHAEEIADTLWPHAGPTALGNVRHFVHALREHLDPGRAKHSRGSFLTTRNGSYALDLALVTIDADEFEAHIETGLAAADAGDADEAVARLERGLDLYGGDFLQDEPYADWALTERDRLRALACRALNMLATVHLGAHRLEEAEAALQQLAELEPLDVEAHRALIALDLRMGRRGVAVRRYEALRRRVRTTFDEALDFTLADLTPRAAGGEGRVSAG